MPNEGFDREKLRAQRAAEKAAREGRMQERLAEREKIIGDANNALETEKQTNEEALKVREKKTAETVQTLRDATAKKIGDILKDGQ